MLRISARNPRSDRGQDRFIYRTKTAQPILAIYVEDGHQGQRIEAVLPRGLPINHLRNTRDAVLRNIRENGPTLTIASAAMMTTQIRKVLAEESDKADIAAIFGEESTYKGKPDAFGELQAQEAGIHD